jgi:sulfite reductase alpha subunit-like flavoprotein
MILYFSGRNKDRDFLFQRELETHLETGILTNLVTTFAYDTVRERERQRGD